MAHPLDQYIAIYTSFFYNYGFSSIGIEKPEDKIDDVMFIML